MKLFASLVLPVLAVFAAYISPVLAEAASTGPQDAQEVSEAVTLPSFVPLSGQQNYASALQSKTSAAAAARHEADKISSLFAGLTTGSIDRSEHEAQLETDAAPIVATDPAKPETSSARSIVLASKKSAQETAETSSASAKTARQVPRAKGSRKANRIPQKAIANESHGLSAGASGPPNLAAVAKNVSVVDLLTNPALWWR